MLPAAMVWSRARRAGKSPGGRTLKRLKPMALDTARIQTQLLQLSVTSCFLNGMLLWDWVQSSVSIVYCCVTLFLQRYCIWTVWEKKPKALVSNTVAHRTSITPGVCMAALANVPSLGTSFGMGRNLEMSCEKPGNLYRPQPSASYQGAWSRGFR